MATVGNPINWTSELANIGLGAISGGVGYAMSNASNYVDGLIGQYFDKKSEKRAYSRQLALMEAQYNYAQRYAENSPTWAVTGLRHAGLNPILAATNGGSLFSSVPSTPSSSSHRSQPTSQSSYDPLLGSQLAVNRAQVVNLENQGKAALINAHTNATKSQSEIRLKDAETALRLLEKDRYESGGNADNPALRDARRTLESILDSMSYSWDYLSDTMRSPYKSTKGSSTLDSFINYVRHGPKSTSNDKKVYSRLESLIDDLSEALPFRGFRHHLRGTSRRVRSLINTR